MQQHDTDISTYPKSTAPLVFILTLLCHDTDIDIHIDITVS